MEGFEESEGPKLLGVVVIGGYMFDSSCKFSNSSSAATICTLPLRSDISYIIK